ncbi:MAG: bifunctional nuclease family protein [Chthoniobacterales bacterium]
MNKPVVEIKVREIIPTPGGSAVFLGNDDKVFVIYVDPGVGSAISMFLNGAEKERPLTHDLIALLLTAFGAKVERIIINDLKSGTYFGRLILSAENELQQRKIIELDARPSDCIALALQQKSRIYISQDVWDEVEDMSEVLQQLHENKDPEQE